MFLEHLHNCRQNTRIIYNDASFFVMQDPGSGPKKTGSGCATQIFTSLIMFKNIKLAYGIFLDSYLCCLIKNIG